MRCYWDEMQANRNDFFGERHDWCEKYIFHTQDLCLRTNLRCAGKQRKNGDFL